jgi:hypothetical protein
MRTMTAFYIAPLAVPLILLVHPASMAQNGHVPVFGLIFAYPSAFMLGMPIYLFLCARRLTAFWIAPIAGFAVGAILMCVGFLPSTLPPNASILSIVGLLLDPLQVGGLAGAVVGMVLWLIARPDQRRLLECPVPERRV